MRTAFFIQEMSTVTIRAEESRDASVELYRYNGDPAPAVGTHKLTPGIYLIVSNGSMHVEGVRGNVQVVTNDKDNWPDSPNLVRLPAGASTESVKAFLTVALDLSVDG